jgi:hypothetical protein
LQGDAGLVMVRAFIPAEVEGDKARAFRRATMAGFFSAIARLGAENGAAPGIRTVLDKFF